MKRIAPISILTIILFISVTIGCSKDTVSKPPSPVDKVQPVAVKVEQVMPQPISKVYETTGDVVVTKKVTLGATIDGPIVFCPWREGDWVQAGKKVVEIDRPLYREDVANARATLAVAQAKLEDLKAGARPEEIAQAKETVKKLKEAVAFAARDQERIGQLVERGGLPGEALEKAKVAYVDLKSQLVSAEKRLAMLESGPTKTAIAIQEALVQEAQAKLKWAQVKVAEGTIIAPFTGVVTKVYVGPGDLASLKSPLLEILDPSSLLVRFTMPEAIAAAHALDPKSSCDACPILISLDAYPGKSYRAKVARVYPEIDRQTRHRIVEAKILEKVDLASGMFARIKVSVQNVPDALSVPTEAVITTLSGDKAVVTVKEGKAVRVKVSTGIVQGDRTQIISGIQAGDQVVVLGQKSVKDGAPVKIVDGGKSAPGEGKQEGGTSSEEKAPTQKGGNPS
jgi:multidrug efflux pump subunit AcrA (membrane-fusion protein)